VDTLSNQIHTSRSISDLDIFISLIEKETSSLKITGSNKTHQSKGGLRSSHEGEEGAGHPLGLVGVPPGIALPALAEMIRSASSAA
jgi:hypothetical protein